MIDVVEEINASQRELGTRTLEAGEAKATTITRVYPAEVSDVWDALTTPERLQRWFLPVEGELREGGRYQLKGNAGGTIERCEPPTSFTTTWEFGGEVTWLTVTLAAESAERTRFTLEHVAHVDSDRWAQFGPGATGVGWDLSLLGLGLHFAGDGEPVDHEAFEAWSTSDEGRAFVTASSTAWRDASVAGGIPADEATAMADQVTAFYTGEPVS